MRFWPWRRARPQPSEDARAAVWEARRALLDANRLGERVDAVANELRETSRRNHFAAAVARAIRGA